MKIVVYGPDKRTGIIQGNKVADISLAYAKYLAERENEAEPVVVADAMAPSELGRLIEGGDRALANVKKATTYLFGRAKNKLGPNGEQIIYNLADVKLHAPRPKGARVACAGGNFADHAAAMAEKAAARGEMRAFSGDHRQHIRKGGIWGFWKVDRESQGQDGEVPYPGRATRLDYEGEIAIVLGKEGKNIKKGRIRDYIWGVTLLGDWSIRLAQEPGPLKFALQKNFDNSCSIGPCIVVGELDALKAQCETRVNGRRRQYYNTKDMVFTFGEYLEHLSKDFTFYPGDIISGGTAAGTAADSSKLGKDGKPTNDRFLKPGDSVEIRNPVIGTLRTKIVRTQK